MMTHFSRTIPIRATLLVILSLFLLAGCSSVKNGPDRSAQKPSTLPVKVVIVTMFEIGEDVGDRAGEFQLWKERRNLQAMPFHGYRDLHYDAQNQMLVIVTGIGTARAAAATMALGMDDRFDLTKSYWLVAGIAGIDPEDALCQHTFEISWKGGLNYLFSY